MTTLFIKNMVCNRCVLVVAQLMVKLNLQTERVSLGEVVVTSAIPEEVMRQVDDELIALGFERIDDRKGRLVESIKNKVISLIHHHENIDTRYNWSSILADELHYDYNYLSNLFSSLEGTTLEQYIIKQKIERAKELLFYDELNLSQIADKLGYSSVAHLSAQFKKVTGFTPSELKKSKKAGLRKPLDTL